MIIVGIGVRIAISREGIMHKVCPECGSYDVAKFGSIDYGDLRCIIDGMPLHLFIDTNN